MVSYPKAYIRSRFSDKFRDRRWGSDRHTLMKDKRIAMKPLIQVKALFQQFFYLCLYRWLTPKGRSLVVDHLFIHSCITDPNNIWKGRLKPTTSLIDLYRGKNLHPVTDSVCKEENSVQKQKNRKQLGRRQLSPIISCLFLMLLFDTRPWMSHSRMNCGGS